MWSCAKYDLAHNRKSSSRYRRRRYHAACADYNFGHRLSRGPWKIRRIYRRNVGYCQRCRPVARRCEKRAFGLHCTRLIFLQVFADHVSWRWCFFINLCVASICIFTCTFVDETPGQPEELPVSSCSSSSTSTLTRGRAFENTSVNLTLLDLASWSRESFAS